LKLKEIHQSSNFFKTKQIPLKILKRKMGGKLKRIKGKLNKIWLLDYFEKYLLNFIDDF
jgi:hypothetical protein